MASLVTCIGELLRHCLYQVRFEITHNSRRLKLTSHLLSAKRLQLTENLTVHLGCLACHQYIDHRDLYVTHVPVNSEQLSEKWRSCVERAVHCQFVTVA